jgi:hypothetical protein
MKKMKKNMKFRLMGIFGTGRSGSSWLGSIVDSHPEVAYRFEPFHRLKKYPTIYNAYQLLEADSIQETDLIKVYEALLPADAVLERPPFFLKNNAFITGKTWFRPLARKYLFFNPLFKLFYSPRSYPPIVFKEVTMEPLMANLLVHTSMPVVYLVRHPCAVVASTLVGQQQGVMPSGRLTILAELLGKHDAELAQRYVPQLDKMGLLEKEALLWRIDVEKGIFAAKNHPNALIIIYEKLCDDPNVVSQQVFNHFQLEFSTQTVEYLAALKQEKLVSQELGVKAYFSVLRNPTAMKNKWQQSLSKQEQQQILKMIQDSAVFQFCADLGNWEVI